MVDYGRLEAGTPTGGNQIHSTNFGIGSQITIPDGRQITSLSFYAHTADATTKYRPYAYLRSGSMTGTGSNLISAPEQTGFALGLNTITLSTPYTNSSGASQEIYFGLDIIVSTIDKYIWNVANFEQPYFANGGSDTPPGTAPAFTSNSGRQAHFVSGPAPATNYSLVADVGTFALDGQAVTITKAINGGGGGFALGVGVFAVAGQAISFTMARGWGLDVGAFVFAGQATTRAIAPALATGVFTVTANPMAWQFAKFYSHDAPMAFRLRPRLQKSRVLPPILAEERQK